MRKARIVLLALLTAVVFSGCATIQSIPVKKAPNFFKTSLPRTIVVAPLKCGLIIYKKKLKGEKKEKFVKKLQREYKKIDPLIFEKGREKIIEILKKKAPGFKIMKKAPKGQEYLLVETTIGEWGTSLAGLLMAGQYGQTMFTSMKVKEMPEGTTLLEHKAVTVKNWMYWSRTIFYNAIRGSATEITSLLEKSKHLRAGN